MAAASHSDLDYWTIVLDDDPTGTQGLHDVPVVVEPAEDTFRWALETGAATYVFTNTRALTAQAAGEAIARAVEAALPIARQAGKPLRWISRGDSTLRGHFPLELEKLRSALSGAEHYRGILLVPAFPAAGRVTLDGVHYVEANEQLIPVGESEFARDATFGYSDSRLTEWARKRIPTDWQVATIPSSIFDDGLAVLLDALLSVQRFTVLCPSIRDEEDLALLASAQREAERWGAQFLTQSGPAYARHLAGLTPATAEQPVEARGHGLIVVGSHTAITNAQLAQANASHKLALIEVNVTALVHRGQETELRRCVTETIASLHDRSVVLSTSRQLLRGRDAASSLEQAQAVARALAEIVRRVLSSARIAYVIGKGGITSHDLIERGLGWRACTVVGPLIAQTLPVVASWPPQQVADAPVCIVFPGNVGRADLLGRALDRLGVPANDNPKAVSR